MPSICFVSYEFFPTTWGGCGVLLHNLCIELLRRNFEIHLIIDVPRQYFKQLDEIDRYQLPNNRSFHVHLVEDFVSNKLKPSDFKTIFEWHSYRFYMAAKWVDHRYDVQVFEFFDYCGPAYCSLNAKLAGIAFKNSVIAVRLHNSLEVMDANEATTVHNRARYRAFALEHSSLSSADCILFPTRKYLEIGYRKYYEKWSADEIHAPPPVVTWPEARSGDSSGHAFLFYGRLFSWKGIDLFVDAALAFICKHKCSDVEFLIVGYDSNAPPIGTGTYAEYLDSKIPADLKKYFKVLGHLSWQELQSILPSVRAAAFPSYFESFCYAAHELYNAQIPLMVSNTPAFMDYFMDGKNALVFDLTVESLAACFYEAYTETEKFKGLTNDKSIYGRTDSSDAYYQIIKKRELTSSAEKKIIRRSILLIVFANSTTLNKTGFKLPPAAYFDIEIVLAVSEMTATKSVPHSLFLGRRVVFYTAAGEALGPAEVKTKELLLILEESDELTQEYFDVIYSATNDNRLFFVGAWKRSEAGDVISEPIDALPEAMAFFSADLRTRAIIKTQRGIHLVDVFDFRAKALGEVELIIRLIADGKRGITIPKVLIANVKEGERARDLKGVSWLAIKETSSILSRRLARLALVANSEKTRTEIEPSQEFSQDVEVIVRRITGNFQHIYERHPYARGTLKTLFKLIGKMLSRKQ